MHKSFVKNCTCIFCERLRSEGTMTADLEALYSENMSRAIDQMPGITDAARKAVTTGTASYELTPDQLAEAMVQSCDAYKVPELTKAQLDYMLAREALAADKAKPQQRPPFQQDEQLDYAYQNGYTDGRRSAWNVVASVVTVLVLLAMLCTCIGLIAWQVME